MRQQTLWKIVDVYWLDKCWTSTCFLGRELVFVRMLDVEYLGVNGFIDDVLSSSLLLQKIGSGSVVINGYKTLKQVKDEKKIKA